MNPNPSLEVVGLHAGYGKVNVLSDVNLGASPGELVLLVGANGAGKTTTLRTMAGKIKPSQGEVRWMGQPTTAPLYRLAREGLRVVSERKAIFPSLTTAQNLRLADAERTGVELFPELAALMDRPARLLSGGEQQMLVVARALANRPKVLLADELSLGLAPMIVRRLLDALREAADRDGVAVVLVEQQVRAALAVADRGYVMQRGRLVLEGAADSLKENIAEVEAAYLSSGPTTQANETEQVHVP